MAYIMLIYIVLYVQHNLIIIKYDVQKKNAPILHNIYSNPPFLWVTTSVNEPVGHSYQL